MPAPDPSGSDCPCGTGRAFKECCGPFLDGHLAPTAEQLMRSRYTAYVRRDEDHLFRTWHPRTRPDPVTAPAGAGWSGLEVLASQGGGPEDETGVVEFVAHHRDGQMHEVSRFARRVGRWVYVDGT